MYVTKRPAFAMIMAIFIVMLIAMGGALLMRGGAQESKAAGDKYLYAQAQLLAKSAVEFALMRAQGFDTTGGDCLNNISISVNSAGGDPMFDIDISMLYSFKGPAPTGGTCNALQEGTGKDTTILMDVTVTDHDIATEPIRIHERSWQKL